MGLVLASALILGITVAVTVRGGADEPLEPILLATGDWAPFSGEQLESYGVASEIVSAVLRQMGYDPDFRFMPWDRAEQAALENETNQGVRAAFPYGFSATLQRDFYYSEPLLRTEFSAYYNARRHPAGATIATTDDLVRLDFRIIPIIGYRYPPAFQDVTRGQPADAAARTNIDAFRELVASGDRLVVLEATQVGDQLLGGPLGAEADAIARAELRFDSPIHVIASRRNPNNWPFIRRFNLALGEVRRSGALAQIEGRLADVLAAQRIVTLEPLEPASPIEAFESPAGGDAILLPRGTRAVVERWSSNYLKPRPPGAAERELMRVRVLNGPKRGLSLYVDERMIVLP